MSILDLDNNVITKQMNIDSGLIAKVQIVGSESTVKAVTTIMGKIGAAIMELMLDRGALLSRQSYITVVDELRSKEMSELERLVSMMKSVNLEGNRDQRLWDVINNNIKFHTEERDRYMNEIKELRDKQNNEHLIFTKKCMAKFFDISYFLPDAILSVRADLNLPISNEAYLDIFNENIEMGKKVFQGFFDNLGKEFGDV
ncbi:hypothetical protein [Thiohalophilus sp.]|uniref:hypothetical protein n=1 Tax=Thiohalophilus sp. TaxID=3028392 RepID=UPI002ACD5091|nr:hypothetical protein [Thiohalophilus sp.]MDZ7805467.1 hypothetical protein [Thiohalophilus sp.]